MNLTNGYGLEKRGTMEDNAIFIMGLVATDDVVAVEVGAWVDEVHLYTAKGSSKRDVDDRPNREIGLKLAIGRAVRQLGRDILHDANSQVHDAAKIRAAQEAASAASRAKAAKKAAAAKRAIKKAAPAKKAAKKATKTTK